MTASLEAPTDRWYPSQPTETVITTDLTRGQIVIAERRPFRIDRIRELPTDKWPERFVKAWQDRGMPDAATWWERPFLVTGFWEDSTEDTRGHSTTAPASHSWDVLPEHYAVCRHCGELPPCSHVHNERIMDRATERMAEDMAILPGVCHGCREPISSRQKSFTFPGENLIRPDLGDHTAIFHTRNRCLWELRKYDKRWATAETDRMPLFFCEGTLVHHFDGTPECDNEACGAKGELVGLVDHRCQIWHNPGTPERMYDAMRDFGGNPGAGNAGCWCLEGAVAS